MESQPDAESEVRPAPDAAAQPESAAKPEPPAEPAPPAEPTAADLHAEKVLAQLRATSPGVEAQARGNYVEVLVPVEQLEATAKALRDQLGYALLSMVTAVDWPDRIEVVYLAYSLSHSHGVYLKANLPRTELPDCPSLTSVWAGAEFQERETYDLMGINFVGHPDLRRILNDDDFPGHPLRKDFHIAPDYVLMRHLRFGAEGQLGPEGSGVDGNR